MHLGKDIKEDSNISAFRVRQWIYLPLGEVGMASQK